MLQIIRVFLDFLLDDTVIFYYKRILWDFWSSSIFNIEANDDDRENKRFPLPEMAPFTGRKGKISKVIYYEEYMAVNMIILMIRDQLLHLRYFRNFSSRF